MAGGLQSNYSDDEGGTLSDINVTPLVDVVLVLLIVFMITVPAVVGAARIDVNLPQTSYAGQMEEVVKLPMHLYLRRGQNNAIQLNLDERTVSIEELEELLKAQKDIKSQPMTVSCDETIPYGEVVKVIDRLMKCGVSKLSLPTRHVEPTGG